MELQTKKFDPLYPWDPAYFQFTFAKFYYQDWQRYGCGSTLFIPWVLALHRSLEQGQCLVTSLSIEGPSFSIKTFPLLSSALVLPGNSIQVLELTNNTAWVAEVLRVSF
jgi:hypothetical protein